MNERILDYKLSNAVCRNSSQLSTDNRATLLKQQQVGFASQPEVNTDQHMMVYSSENLSGDGNVKRMIDDHKVRVGS